MTPIMASGQASAQAVTKSRTMEAFVLNKSSLVIPKEKKMNHIMKHTALHMCVCHFISMKDFLCFLTSLVKSDLICECQFLIKNHFLVSVLHHQIFTLKLIS